MLLLPVIDTPAAATCRRRASALRFASGVGITKHLAMGRHTIDGGGPTDARVLLNVALIEQGTRGDQQMESYAVYILGRYRAGETVDQLVAAEGIPRKRLIMRLRVAAKHVQAQQRALRAGARQRPCERAA